MFRKKYLFDTSREYRLKETVDYPNDRALRDTVVRYGEELGEHGRFTVKFKGIRRKIQVLIEAYTGKLCRKYVNAFQDFLEKGDYLDCPEHEWRWVYEEDHGEMNYDSAGGGVPHFIVKLEICSNCGVLRKTSHGDCAEDPEEYTGITDEDLLRP